MPWGSWCPWGSTGESPGAPPGGSRGRSPGFLGLPPTRSNGHEIFLGDRSLAIGSSRGSWGLWWILYCLVLYCLVLYRIVLYCLVLFCIVLYCIMLYYYLNVLYYAMCSRRTNRASCCRKTHLRKGTTSSSVRCAVPARMTTYYLLHNVRISWD